VSDSQGAWFAAGLAFLAVSVGIVALALLWSALRARRQRKLVVGRIQGGPDTSPEEQAVQELFQIGSGELQGFELLASRIPHMADLRRLLDQSGLGWRPNRFFLLTLVSAVVFGLAGYLLTRVPVVALLPALIGAILPYLYVRRKKKKRLDAFEELFPEAIDLLGRSIRAGHAFTTGLQMVCEELDEPVATEFQRVFDEQRFGLSIEDSLQGLCERVELVDVRIFVTAVLIQREVGGNLAEILDNLSRTIRERFTIRRQLRVYTAQGRFTGYLLAALPLIMAFMISALNREYMRILFEEPAGRMMIALAVMLQITGYFIIRRIINIEI
jgi:tight adherence protein B